MYTAVQIINTLTAIVMQLGRLVTSALPMHMDSRIVTLLQAFPLRIVSITI